MIIELKKFLDASINRWKKISCFIHIVYITDNNLSTTKISISDFSLKEIEIENNFVLEDKEIKKVLPFYNKNLISINYSEIDAIMKNSFIESFKVKKISKT